MRYVSPRSQVLVATTICFLSLCLPLYATTYRAGPGEEYATVSEVGSKLEAGDTVEVTGDISDSFTLTAQGTLDKPVVVRGVTRIEGGKIIRPRITPPSLPCASIATCKGGWTVLEGLDISGQTEGALGNAAIIQACPALAIRNCRIHHNYRAIHSVEQFTRMATIEFCEFDANGYAERPPIAFYSVIPNAMVVVENCYFHDGTGANYLRLCVPRSVVRYNWFENPYEHAVQVSCPEIGTEPARLALAETLMPCHSDIVGNVVIFGWGPGSAYCAFSLGGDSPEAPGTEGDFCIAHNMVLTRRGGATPQVAVLVHGNVNHVNIYNNIFLEGGVRGCMLYSREQVWQGSRREAFIRTRGDGEPVVRGANNWISETATGVPASLSQNVFGTNPRFMNFVGFDFHPQPDSPLAGTGMFPLPAGSIVSLLPEYEPQRGVALDLKGVPRRRVAVPSIGPFEVSEVAPPFEDDSSDLVLNVRDSGGRFAWPFDFGGWRHRALENLYAGRPNDALACATMQYIVSPMDESSLSAAIRSVDQMLVASRGTDAVEQSFADYIEHGTVGADGMAGTADDVAHLIALANLSSLTLDGPAHQALDSDLDRRAAIGVGSKWPYAQYEQRWYESEKALIRAEHGAFDEALAKLTSILVESIKEPCGDIDGQKAMQRNQSLIERVAAGLTVIGRYRRSSPTEARRFAESVLAYARRGPAGHDRIMGSKDDIDILALLTTGVTRWPPAIDALKESSTAHLAGDVRAVNDACAGIIHKFELIAAARNHPGIRAFLCTSPTPEEYLDRTREAYIGSLRQDDLTGAGMQMDPDDTRADAVAVADEAVVDAYCRIRDAKPDDEAIAGARFYLAAYVAGIHDNSTYGRAVALLTRKVTQGRPPVFLVRDVCSGLGRPFLAGHVFDDLAAAGVPWSQEEREDLLTALEKAQFEAIRLAQAGLSGLPDSESRPGYTSAVTDCHDYLNRFPTQGNIWRVRFYLLFSRYQIGEHEALVEEVRSFTADCPDPDLVANARFVEALVLLKEGRTSEAVTVLDALAARYPQGELAAKSLYTAGYSLMLSGDAGAAAPYFQRVCDFYPGSRYAADAKAHMETVKHRGRE